MATKNKKIITVNKNMNELDRYNRQVKIWGEDGQKKLTNAKVVIVGADNGAKYTALPLTAMGLGEIRILGSDKSLGSDMLMDIRLENEFKAEGYVNALRNLNPNINLISAPIDLETKIGRYFLQDASIIIDTTNNPRSKSIVFDYAMEKDVPVISSGIGNNHAKLMLWKFGRELTLDYLMPNFEGQSQGALTSLLWGGIIAEEVKKIILNLKGELSKTLYYNQGADNRFAFSDKKFDDDLEFYKNKSAFVIGAGALGNIMTIALAEAGIGYVDYLDYDDIESHNLNRQVLFYDSVGMPKAKTLANKHRKMNPEAAVRGFVKKFELDKKIIASGIRKNYDLILDLVDNLYTRATISAYAVMRDSNLISAASSPDAAQVATYVPGKTSCMNHVFAGYYEKGVQEEIIRRQSCIAQPDPSVIMTNQIGAALAALEIRRVLGQDKPFNGFLKYAANLDSRLGQSPINKVCNCNYIKDIPDLEVRI